MSAPLELVGFVVAEVRHDPKAGQTDGLVITAADGRVLVLDLDGDCCSASYFEGRALEDAQSIEGQVLRRVEHVCSALEPRADVSESVLYKAVQLTTDRQAVTLDWRNESNGYYSGWCTVLLDGRARCTR